MTASRLRRTAFATLALSGLAAGASAQNVQVQHVCKCWISSLSADGSAAAGTMDGTNAIFRWTAKDGLHALGRNPSITLGVSGGTTSISADGKVIGATIANSTGTLATEGRWTASSGWLELDHPLPADGGAMDNNDAMTFGMSSDGSVVTGLYWRPGQTGGSAHASVWSAATGMVGMPTAGGSSRIDGANHDGSVLVGWEEDPTSGARQATVWANGTKTTLVASDGWTSEAHAINSAGTILAGQSLNPASQHEEATVWTWNGTGWDARWLGLGIGATTSASSYAISLSDDGQLVAGMFRNKFSEFSSGSFVWTPASGFVDAGHWLQTQGVDIHPNKFSIQQVSAVSADGRVLAFIGQENQPPFAYHSFLVTRLDVPARH